jgi:hypothetical protein
MGQLLLHGTANTAAGRRARVELSYGLTHHHSVLDRAAAKDPRLRSLKETDDSLVDNGYTALANAWL